MTDAPAPLTDHTHDVTGLDGFMLNTDLLMASELWALASGDELKAAVGLWCRAWKQTPPGSLPDDDRVLAAFSGAGREWPKVKEMALRGFIKCSDGRLYHGTLCADVVRASAAKAARHARTKAATEARNAMRNGERGGERYVERDDKRRPTVTESHRRDETGIEGIEGRNAGAVAVSRETEKPQPEQLAHLEHLLREAAGWQAEPAPGLFVTGEIQTLIDNGADLHMDVLAVVKAHAPQCRRRTTWRYFLPMIAQARDDRAAAATLVSPPRPQGGSHARRPSTGNIAAILGLAEESAGIPGEG